MQTKTGTAAEASQTWYHAIRPASEPDLTYRHRLLFLLRNSTRLWHLPWAFFKYVLADNFFDRPPNMQRFPPVGQCQSAGLWAAYWFFSQSLSLFNSTPDSKKGKDASNWFDCLHNVGSYCFTHSNIFLKKIKYTNQTVGNGCVESTSPNLNIDPNSQSSPSTSVILQGYDQLQQIALSHAKGKDRQQIDQ